jgi:predicted phage-related endonuclease
VDPFLTPASLWALKVYPTRDQEENEKMALGHALEPGLVRLCAERMGVKLGPGGQHKGANGVLRAQPDRIAYLGAHEVGLIEAKTTGLEGWGDPEQGPEAVPAKVLVQVAAQMYCIPNAIVAWVPALIGRFGLTMNIYQITRQQLDSRGIIQSVAQIVADFWSRYVSTRTAPPEQTGLADLDVLKRIVRVPGKRVILPAHVGAMLPRFDKIKGIIAGLERERDRMKATIIQALEDAEMGVADEGAVEYPEIIQHRKAQEAREITTRRLNVRLNPLMIPPEDSEPACLGEKENPCNG